MTKTNQHLNLSQFDPSNPYIPLNMFLTMPNAQDDYYVGQGKSMRRFLFEATAKQTYTTFQKQKYKQLADYWQQNKSKIPTNIVNNPFWNQQWKMRWLTSQKFNVKNAIKAMQAHSNYLSTNRFNVPPEIEKVLKNGVFYVSGRDAYLRPILVFDIDKMIRFQLTAEQLIESQKFFFEVVVNSMLLPGQVETWVAIIDVGFRNLGSLISPLKSSIGFLSSTFRNRMRIAYVVRVPGSVSFLWSIVKRFLEEDTAQKINFFQEQQVTPLLKYANTSQLQAKYGGTQSQITQFWPPRTVKRLEQLNLLDFSHAEVKNNQISVQDYRTKFQKGKLQGHKMSKFLLKDEEKQKEEQQKRILEQQKLEDLKLNKSGTVNSHLSPRSTQNSKTKWPVEYKPLKAPQIKIQDCICWEKLII